MAMRERRLDAGVVGLGDRLGIVAGLVLAISSFTGWYSGDGEGVTISVIGWHTGILGKLVFFVGVAVVVVLVLREPGIEAPAALPQSLLTVVLGALGTIFVLIRVISVPDDFFFAGRGVGIWIALAAAIGVIVAGLLQASERSSRQAQGASCGRGSSVRTKVCVPAGTGRSSSAWPSAIPSPKRSTAPTARSAAVRHGRRRLGARRARGGWGSTLTARSPARRRSTWGNRMPRPREPPPSRLRTVDARPASAAGNAGLRPSRRLPHWTYRRTRELPSPLTVRSPARRGCSRGTRRRSTSATVRAQPGEGARSPTTCWSQRSAPSYASTSSASVKTPPTRRRSSSSTASRCRCRGVGLAGILRGGEEPRAALLPLPACAGDPRHETGRRCSRSSRASARAAPRAHARRARTRVGRARMRRVRAGT